MPVWLPTLRLPQTATPRPLDFGAWQTPQGGGAAQRLERLGSRWALDIVTPRLRRHEDRRQWIAALLLGISDTVLYPLPQPGLKIGAPGTPAVDGAGQAGTTIALRGLMPGYAVRLGQFFSIIIGGQRFLYTATGQTLANADGKASVAIWPALRRSPGDGAVCEFVRPTIEGALSGNEKGWTEERAGTNGLTLTITETE